jgi:hypothetical protein
MQGTLYLIVPIDQHGDMEITQHIQEMINQELVGLMEIPYQLYFR